MTFTLAVTSCDRHDLLKRTLDSFVNTTSLNPHETIIFEDSDKERPSFLDTYGVRLGKVRFISGGRRRGQAYAIDRLYSEVKTEYVFHTEDDWEFHESGFIPASFNLLCSNPDLSMVALRSDWNHPLIDDPKSRGFKIAEPYWGKVWGGTCWNPGLRRLSDFKKFGNYGRHVGYGTNGLGHEAKWSTIHLDAGFRIACLPSYVRHIGDNRSRAIEPIPVTLPRILIAVPACQQLDYGAWESEQSPKFDRAKAYRGEAYGTDIHISGPNPRVDAVRGTWFKDTAAHEHHATARFFYGKPFVGEPKADEVLLDVGSDYASLPLRTQAICKYALEQGYDYLYKCDDDTAVYVDRLVREIMDGICGDYAGCLNDNVCTGGPGYITSRRGMAAVAKAGTPDHWAEDCWVAKVMGNNSIYPVSLPTHLPGYMAHWYFPAGYTRDTAKEKLKHDTVAFHAVQPEVMRDWHKDIAYTYSQGT
jgi:hypothetical protein